MKLEMNVTTFNGVMEFVDMLRFILDKHATIFMATEDGRKLMLGRIELTEEGFVVLHPYVKNKDAS